MPSSSTRSGARTRPPTPSAPSRPWSPGCAAPWATRPWSSSRTRATGSPSRATPSTPSGSDGLARRGRDLLAAGDAATARSTLAEALDLWRGPALADADDGEYAVALAARLDEERLDALAARVDADLALGHAADVVAELEDRTRANPLREQLTGQLMRALAATGRPAEALAAYERLRSTLADTLGTDPSPALRELHLALLREDVPGAQPPIGRRPGLRAGLTSFLGREAETERVVGVLTGSRLATVVGPGGAGKTRLATEVGRAWQAAHGGGASLVELAPVRDENGVLPAFLAALDLREAIVLERTREARRGTDDFSLLVATLECRAVPARRRQLRAPARRRRAARRGPPGVLPHAAGAGHQPRTAGGRRGVALRPSAARAPTVGGPARRGHVVCVGAALRRACLRGPLRAGPRRVDPGTGRRDRATPRRSAAGHRAGGGEDPGAARVGGRETALRPVPAADRWPPHRAPPPPDAPGRRRVELGPPHRRRAAVGRAARRLPRRVDDGERHRGLRR